MLFNQIEVNYLIKSLSNSKGAVDFFAKKLIKLSDLIKNGRLYSNMDEKDQKIVNLIENQSYQAIFDNKLMN